MHSCNCSVLSPSGCILGHFNKKSITYFSGSYQVALLSPPLGYKKLPCLCFKCVWVIAGANKLHDGMQGLQERDAALDLSLKRTRRGHAEHFIYILK